MYSISFSSSLPCWHLVNFNVQSKHYFFQKDFTRSTLPFFCPDKPGFSPFPSISPAILHLNTSSYLCNAYIPYRFMLWATLLGNKGAVYFVLCYKTNEKVSLHSNPKERQCQRMPKLPHNCTHLPH